MVNKSVESNMGNIHADRSKWGYAVFFGTIITFVPCIGHVNSFGLIYKEFIDETHSTAKSFTTVHGIFVIMLAVGGIFLNILAKRFSLRQGGLFGTLFFVMGSFMTVFITNITQLQITFGVLQGIGFGMMVPVCYSTLNYYFIRKRTAMLSLCKGIQGLVFVIYPQFIKKCMSYYGFRGTLLILSGVSLHTIIGMLMMRTKESARTARNKRAGDQEHETLELVHKTLREQDKATTHHEREFASSKYKNRSRFLEILNVNVLRDSIFCNILIGQCLVNFSDSTFFILQPMLLFQYGFDKMQVAMCLSISAGADMVGRFALSIVSSFIIINTRHIFYVASLFTFIFKIAILQVRQLEWLAILTSCLGFLRAWLHVASPLVIGDHVSHQDFPGAYAMFMLASGLINLTLSPLVGLLKDVYHDYEPSFYVLSLCCLPCLILWPLEYFFKNKLKK